ncbi:MAG: alpha-glucosidase C-terminal domain-containing protein, partial [Rhodothermales bacterium]|nr:alpha-glucosidase C-terminal domain-containing protein [Rhodothermales bacterium]
VKVFGRGTFELVPVDNPSVLAFVRAYEGERILVVANLSRYAQAATLPPDDAYGDLVPVELFSQNAFPTLAAGRPYPVLLGPHGFYWFALRPEEELQAVHERPARPASHEERAALPVLRVAEGLENLLIKTLVRDDGMERLEALLPDFLARQRWFGAKDRAIRGVRIRDAVRLQARPFPVYLSVIRVDFEEGESARYLLPLALAQEAEADRLLDERKEAVLAWVEGPGEGRGLLHDAAPNPAFWTVLFRWWQREGKGRSLQGLYTPEADAAARGAAAEDVRVFSGEQSNSSAVLDDRFYVKLYRRLEDGTNPETELLRHLTDAGFKFIPRLHGTLDFRRPDQRYALGILQEALPVETDAWTYAREMTTRFLERVAGTTPPEAAEAPAVVEDEAGEDAPAWLGEVASEMLALARLLGIRTAELHRAFARAEAPALRPHEGTPEDTALFLRAVRDEAGQTRRALADHAGRTNGVPSEVAWEAALDRLRRLEDEGAACPRLRVHGDYHLGQVVRADGEFYLLDFEGEPARSLDERRARDCGLRDVAGMLRSLEYAALSAWQDYEAPALDDRQRDALRGWTLRLVHWCEQVFVDAYYATAEDAGILPDPAIRADLLWAYLVHKALYEVRYELSHRPDWTWLPLRGLQRLLAEAAPSTGDARPEEEAA